MPAEQIKLHVFYMELSLFSRQEDEALVTSKDRLKILCPDFRGSGMRGIMLWMFSAKLPKDYIEKDLENWPAKCVIRGKDSSQVFIS